MFDPMSASLLAREMHQMVDVSWGSDASAVKLGMIMLYLPLLGLEPYCCLQP